MLVCGIMGLSLLSYERVERVSELAGGHLVPVTPARKSLQRPINNAK
jgi:hypothetical protein